MGLLYKHFRENTRLNILVTVELEEFPQQRLLGQTVRQTLNMELFKEVYPIPDAERYKTESNLESRERGIPCGDGVEYLDCSPVSRRRRRKGKSRI
jgi:hypothetical protein